VPCDWLPANPAAVSSRGRDARNHCPSSDSGSPRSGIQFYGVWLQWEFPLPLSDKAWQGGPAHVWQAADSPGRNLRRQLRSSSPAAANPLSGGVGNSGPLRKGLNEVFVTFTSTAAIGHY
jgi:hypothetical protein